MSFISFNSLIKGRMKQQKMHHRRRLNKMRFNKFQFIRRKFLFVVRVQKSLWDE